MSVSEGDDLQPVAADEFFYRRIHCSFVDAELPIPIQAAAFRPNPKDRTGLSVFRARFVEPAGTLTTVAEEKRADYLVVRIHIQDLRRLGLSILPEPNPDGPPGHAVIPELSWDRYNADKKRSKEVQFELADIASRNIVYGSKTDT